MAQYPQEKFYALRDRERDQLYVIRATDEDVRELIEAGQDLLGPACDTREEAEVIVAIYRP